jgi:lysophospholipase L1-like esterase
VVIALVAAMLLAGGARQASAAIIPQSLPSGPYVALGDSYTSGPMIANQTGQPSLCFRSDHDYPAIVAQTVHPTVFRDVSCSGASTPDMTQPQPLISKGLPLQHNPAQFDALTPDTTLVTVGIGGNDIGFGGIALTCLTLGVLDPSGAPCTAHFTAGGTDSNAQAIAALGPKLDATLSGIHQRAPRALVLLVGYLDILPTSGNGCWPVVPIAAGDVAYLNGIEQRLNTALANSASANHAIYVDTYTSSQGHDVCQPVGTKWVEGILPTHPAFPIHPNADGMAQSAAQVLGTLGPPAGSPL